jgi:FAD/FMN-containing dehydrogenase
VEPRFHQEGIQVAEVNEQVRDRGAMTASTQSTPIPTTSVDALATEILGELVRPDDPRYDEHRNVWNGSIDRNPALIVRCAGPDDVRTALRFAREQDLLTAIRGGGHSFPGLSTCDGGIVIDLGPMKEIEVDPGTHSVRAEAGVLLGEVDRETQPLGLAVPSGIVSHTGVAGLTLGGGLGWQQRKYGLSIDNLLSVDVITTDGEFVTASEDENPDLFWGLRGGGGNFGVATSFRFHMNPIGPTVMAGPVFWPMENTPQVLRFYREWIDECPDGLTTIVVQRKLPALSTVPKDLVGKRVIAVVACYTGPVEEGIEVLQPLKAFGTPVLDLCEPKTFLVHQSMFDESFRRGCWYYVRSCDVAELTDDVIDIIDEYGSNIDSPMSGIALWQMGGAVSRVGAMETAFHGREAGFTFNINGNTPTAHGFEEEREWARSYWSALSPYHTSVYVNFLMDEGATRVRDAYGPEKYDRLKNLKRKYDPTNLLRLNQNISPD